LLAIKRQVDRCPFHGGLIWAIPELKVAGSVGVCKFFMLAGGMCSKRLILAILPALVYWMLSAFYAIIKKVCVTSTTTCDGEREKNRARPKFVALSVLVQQFVHCTLGYCLLSLSALDNSKSERSFFGNAVRFAAAAIILDAFQYHCHAWMHKTPWAYKHIHATHHRIVSPYAFAALYVHPIESIMLDGVSGMLACTVSGLTSHSVLCSVFLCLSTAKTVSDHSGLDLPYDPFMVLFRNNSQYHELHHSVGKGRGKMHLSQPWFTVWDQFYESRRQRHGGTRGTYE